MPPNKDLQLSFGLWMVNHKNAVAKLSRGAGMGITGAGLIWMVVFFAIFFSQSGKTDKLLIDAANGAGSFSTTAFQPQDLSLGTVTAIVRDEKHVDLVAELTNSNSQWAGQAVTLHFSVDGTSLTPLHLFVNQGEHRPVMLLNVTVNNSSTVQASAAVDDVAWARASAASLPAAVFAVENIVTAPSTVTVSGGTRTSVTVTADVTNQSVYNYYHVDVPVVLSSGNKIIGIGQIGIDRWPTLTMKPVTLTLSYPVPDTSPTVQITPQVNRFDAGNTYR